MDLRGSCLVRYHTFGNDHHLYVTLLYDMRDFKS